jgi:hypothetical protein
MPTVQSIGGRSIVIPMLEIDIDLGAEDAEDRAHQNWLELQAADAMAGRRDDPVPNLDPPPEHPPYLPGGFHGNNGTVLLPAGTIYASEPGENPRSIIELDERHAGITIQGAGREKTL